MEQAIDVIANIEFVDVTPLGLRLRKKTLAAKPSARNKALPVDGRDTEPAVET